MPYYKYKQNQIYFLDSKDDEHFLPSGCISITDQEAEDIRISMIIPPTYTELRAAKYPSIQDQLDMQFHDKINGTNIWQDTIQAIKDSIPKV